MAYDPVRNQIVLFGGYISGTAVSNQTWVWANSAWTQLAPTTSPPGRELAAMAWDPALNEIVMFGGNNVAGTSLGDTWAWDGTNWTQLTPTGAPPVRTWAYMAWDPDLNALVMFGGQATSTSNYLNDTWSFANNTWTQLQASGATGAPAFRVGGGMAFSSSTDQMILFGGYEYTCATCNSSQTLGNDTWTMSGSTWTQLSPATSPSARGEFGMTYDPGLGGVIVQGGVQANGTLASDTWAWNGSTWLQAQTGTSQPTAALLPVLAATNSGQVIGQYGFSPSKTWSYDTGAPVLSVSITNNKSMFWVGDSAQVQISATNTGTTTINPTIIANLTNDLVAGGSQMTWAGSSNLPVCTSTSTTACASVLSSLPTFGFVPLTAGQSGVLGNFIAQVTGNTRGCNKVTIPIFGSDSYGGWSTASTPMTICGGGLGNEKYWTYDTTQLGVGGTASVNAANGNLLIKQTDGTPIQSHGQLAFTLGRAYNSQDNLASPTLSGLGAGWQWDMSATGDAANPGLNVGGLIVPTIGSVIQETAVQPLSVTYVDRDGTRDVFSFRSLSATTGPLTAVLGLNGLVPNLSLNLTNNSDSICVDAAYQAPAGADMSLYRYLDVAGNCGSASSSSNNVLGFAVVRPNRERYDYNLQGQLVDIVDASGNEVKYNYTTPVGGTLSSITSNRCNNGTYNVSDACPKYTFVAPGTTFPGTSTLNPSSYTVGGSSYKNTVVTDPAGRVTTYVTQIAAGGNPDELVQVWNPDNPFTTPTTGNPTAFVGTPSISYTYAPAGGSCPHSANSTITTGALCSATDPAGARTTFAYTPAPLGPDQVLSVTDRRGNANAAGGSETAYTYANYAADGYSTTQVYADTAAASAFGNVATGCPTGTTCQRNNYTGIDQWGRVGELDQGSSAAGTSGNWLHQEAFYWDNTTLANRGTYGCNAPSVVRDNDLCQTISRATPSSAPFGPPLQFGSTTSTGFAASDQVVTYTYDALGLPTQVERALNPTQGMNASNTAVTTFGNHVQYVEAGSTIHAFNDQVVGHTQVTYQTDDATGSYASTVTADNPIAYYKFDNLSGSTTKDYAPHPPGVEQDATESNGTVLGQLGPVVNTAVQEPGNGLWAASVPSLTGFAHGTGASSAFTLETWVNTTNPGIDYTLCAACNGTGVVAGRYTGGKPWLWIAGTTSGHVINVLGTTPVSDGKWHQIDYTYNGSGSAANGGVHIYVDGVDQTAPPLQDTLGATTPFLTDGSPTGFGDNTTSTGPDGTMITQLSLYNAALTSAQVNTHYQAVRALNRYDNATLYSFGDQTQTLTARGNTATNWGDYLTSIRRDEPQSGGSGSSYPLPNTTNGPVCGTASTQNTGLICETDTPASAGVPAGVCQNPNNPGTSSVPPGGPTDSSLAYTCTSATYDANGQKLTSWSAKANAAGDPANKDTTYSYYTDTASCSGAGQANCDLSGNVSAGGWLKSVTDPNNHYVVYAYDRAGNIARTWDRNATTGHNPTEGWTTVGNEPSSAFTESDYSNPVTSNSLSVSAFDTEIVTPAGTVLSSGDNAAGQLGNGTTTNSSTPVGLVGGLHDVVQIGQAAQGGFGSAKVTFALTGSGQVWAWGSNFTTPIQITGMPPIAAISVGGSHELALDRTGGLWAWGGNSYGQLGNGTTNSGYTNPAKIMTGVASFSAGAFNSYAIRTDGTLWGWGYNQYGEVGNNSTTNVLTPTQIMTAVASVSAGVETAYAIKADGTVWAWGDNSQGDLGTGSSASTSLVPTQITSLGVGPGTVNSHGRVRQIAGSVWGAAALLADGSVWAWGLNNTGQLGGAVSGNSGVPVQIPGVSNQVALTGGWATYLSSDEAGQVTIWGQTNSGQLGNNTSPAQVTPQPIGNAFNTGTQSGNEQALSPFTFPWRYRTETRNQLGYRATTTVDADGMPVTTRTPRGNDVFSTADDTYNTYDPGNLLTSSQAPVERGGANGALGGVGAPTVATPTTLTYDAYGNKTSVVDPRGYATLTDYDLMNRAVDVRTTRGTSTQATGSGCTTTASGAGWTSQQSGHMVCQTSTVYDGNDQATSITDANSQTTTTVFDGAGRKVSQTVPRNDGTYTNLTTITAYDLDGNVTDTCPPRQFDAAHEQDTTSAGSCPTTAAYGTHRTYDQAGRVAATTIYRVTGASSATAEVSSTTFDADGNPLSSTDANNHTTSYVYDYLDRKQTISVPRAAGVSYTTSWTYDPAGDVTAVNAPSNNSYGDGASGALVIDGTTASNSTDGFTHNSSNPYVIPNGARYTTVTLQNGGWVTGQPAESNPQQMGLAFTATGAVTVCATCGITQAGNGEPGGAGNNQLLGNAAGQPGKVVGGNGGGAGTGSTNGGGGGGGGHNGAGTNGVGGALLQGNGGAGGTTSGTNDFRDVGTNYELGSGGGGGGAGQGLNGVASSPGGNGGGFIHITAPSITINGTVTAAGANGAYSSNVNGGSGGGAGGGIWLTADTINLSASNDLNVNGGTGGPNSSSGGPGGAGASGYIRLDGAVTNPPAGADLTSGGAVTGYSYDAAHQLIDTVTGFSGTDANVANDAATNAIPDSLGQINERTRIGYDADGHKIISINPRAFTNTASLTNPNLDYSARTDFDADGRPVSTYAPRYNATVTDIGSGGDGGTGNPDQQTTECPTGADPSQAPGYGTYASTTGVCLTRTAYDPDGNVATLYMPTAVGAGNQNRVQTFTYTDDNLRYTVTTPNPTGSGTATASSSWYDGDKRIIKTSDALGDATVTAYTSDGLTISVQGQGYGTVTHVTSYGYNANGQQTAVTQPNSSAPAGFAAADYTTTTTWTSDGHKSQIKAPGISDTSFDVTNYTYDAVGNPTTIQSPNATATGGAASKNTYTYDNLIASTSNPVTSTMWRTTNYGYTPSGQKASSDVGTCTSPNCASGTNGWAEGNTLRYTYAPDGVNVTQVGSDTAGYGPNEATITTAYDQAGNPTKITASDSTVSITAGYYLDGLTRTASDGTNNNTYAYDAAGSLSLRTDQSVSSTGITGGAVKKTSYLYGDSGLPTAGASDVTGTTTAWTYDTAGRNTQRTDTSGGSTVRTVAQTFNPDNTVATLTDSAGGNTIAANTYAYDRNGQILTASVSGAASYSYGYSYNPAGNVTGWTGSANAYTYVWDNDSNRTAIKVSGTTVGTANYNQDNTLASTGGGTNPTVQYTFDPAGQLASTGSASNRTACSTNAYDAFGRTAVQTTRLDVADCGTGSVASSTTNTFDGLDRVQQAVTTGTESGTTHSSYDGLSKQLVGQTGAITGANANPTTLYQLNPTGAAVGISQTPSGGGSATNTWLDKDARGNVTTLVNVGGNSSTCTAQYDPFGGPVTPAVAGPLGNGICSTTATSAGATGNNLWYQANARSTTGGTYQDGSRTYSPATASFTTPDNYRTGTPAKDLSVGTDPLTANTYTYVNGNPINYSDPSGHNGCGWFSGWCNDIKNTAVDAYNAVTSDPVKAIKDTAVGVGGGFIGIGDLLTEAVPSVHLSMTCFGMTNCINFPTLSWNGDNYHLQDKFENALGADPHGVMTEIGNWLPVLKAGASALAKHAPELGDTLSNVLKKFRGGDPAVVPPAEPPTPPAPSGSGVQYGDLDPHGRPTGVTGQLTPDMVQTGTPPLRSIEPPGFEGGPAGHARGHLLGAQLGGPGDDARNLVTLFQNPTNTPAMLSYENLVRSALDAGETVDYSAIPQYVGDAGMPVGVTLRAQSASVNFYVSILNRTLG